MRDPRRLGPHDGYDTHKWMIMYTSEGYPHVGHIFCEECHIAMQRYWYRKPSVSVHLYPVIGICYKCGKITKIGDFFWNQVAN